MTAKTPERPNPWGLTPAQIEAMEALITTGNDKAAAALMGLASKTISFHILKAKKRIGVPTRLQAILAWDRHTRAAQAGGI